MAEQPVAQWQVFRHIVLHCVFQIGMNQFFLVIQNEREERVFIVRITAEEFAFLRRIGIPECMIIDSVSPGMPSTPGMPGIPGMPGMGAQ